MTVYFVSVCGTCTPPMPMPFMSAEERRTWTDAHFVGTGHRPIKEWRETRDYFGTVIDDLVIEHYVEAGEHLHVRLPPGDRGQVVTVRNLGPGSLTVTGWTEALAVPSGAHVTYSWGVKPDA